jgi:hypothetical protein
MMALYAMNAAVPLLDAFHASTHQPALFVMKHIPLILIAVRV